MNSNRGGSPATYEGHCPNCDADRTLIRTPPWLEDTCTRCGSDVPENED